jgi:hypothetical protein
MWVSSRRTMLAMNTATLIRLVTRHGSTYGYASKVPLPLNKVKCSLGLASAPPINGPTTCFQHPKASEIRTVYAPIQPVAKQKPKSENAFPLFPPVSSVISPTMVRATGALPLSMAQMQRETIAQPSDFDSPKSTMESAVDSSPSSKVVLRPILLDQTLQSGVKTICTAKKHEATIPLA